MAPELEADLIRQATAQGHPIPERIANKPQLDMGLQLYYSAFFDLTTCRPSGMGICPIPWTAIREYALTFEFDSEQEEALYCYIRAMDSVFMKYHDDKAENKPNPGPKSRGNIKNIRK